MIHKLLLLLAISGAFLTTGCIVDPAYYPQPYRPRVVEAPAVYPGPGPVVEYGGPEYVVPNFVIVEGGVRHDSYFYQRHPEYYRRDRERYPDRFAHLPPPRRDDRYHRDDRDKKKDHDKKKDRDRDHRDDR